MVACSPPPQMPLRCAPRRLNANAVEEYHIITTFTRRRSRMILINSGAPPMRHASETAHRYAERQFSAKRRGSRRRAGDREQQYVTRCRAARQVFASTRHAYSAAFCPRYAQSASEQEKQLPLGEAESKAEPPRHAEVVAVQAQQAGGGHARQPSQQKACMKKKCSIGSQCCR